MPYGRILGNYGTGGTITPPDPGTGEGEGLSAVDANRLLYNTLILQTPTISDIDETMIPAPYTAGAMYTFNTVDYFRYFNDNSNGAEVMTTDRTNVDATQRIAVIDRTP